MRRAPEDRDGASRRYLRVLAGAVALIAAAVYATTLRLDPYGYSPIGVDVPGVNEHRFTRQRLDREFKPFDVIATQPKTLLVGSSRMKQGLDPSDFDARGIGPTYNLGVDNVTPKDSLALLELLLPLTPSVEYAIIEVRFRQFFQLQSPSTPDALADLALRFQKTAFSWSALAAVIENFKINRWRPLEANYVLPDGRMALPMRDEFMLGLELGFDNLFGPEKASYAFGDASESLAIFDRIQRTCARHQVDCRFAITPHQPIVLLSHYLFGRWDDLERVKRAFARRYGAYDFTRFNPITAESYDEDLTYWQDVFHFTPAMGLHMAAVLTGAPLPNTPANFGDYLTAATVEDSLRAWAAERDAWIAEHPGLVARARRTLQGGATDAP